MRHLADRLTGGFRAGCFRVRTALALVAMGWHAGEGAIWGADAVPPKKPSTPAATSEFAHKVEPVLAKHCTRCHSGEEPKGDLRLDQFHGAVDLTKDRPTWESVLENLESHAMPPEGEPSLPPADRQAITSWIEAGLDRADAQGKRDPGRVTMRRLNRVEYDNTVRDLLGVTFHPSDDFPSDDVGYGFDNIGDVLSLPTILLEKYLAAADKISRTAIESPELRQIPSKFIPAEKLESDRKLYLQDGAKTLATNGTLTTKFRSPRDGDYVFRVKAAASQAGDEPARMELRVDKLEPKKFDVANEPDAPKVFEARLHLTKGERPVAIAFVNDFWDPKAPKGHQDRNLFVEFVEIRGPMEMDPKALPESHKRLITRRPKDASDFESTARAVIEPFATRAFRRPLRPGELDRLVKLADLSHRQGDSFERSVQLVVQAVLVSPHFLFRVEADPPGNSKEPRHLNDFELASRLSYFLWSSMPDDELLAQARQGKLHSRDVLLAQVKRMVASPKSQALVANFAGQWLQTRTLSVAAPDAKKYPTFDEPLRAAMQRETELFFAAVLRDNRSIVDFIDADYTFVNERLAKHYGLEGVKGDEFRRVKLPDHRRGGVITQASLLTVTSNPTRTSPVKRGKWILENILGTPPPPPPAMVAELSEDDKVVLSGTLRQRMEQHRVDPACASCHYRMDPLGFGLENFDGIGRWRTEDGKFAIDASGTLPSGDTFDGPQKLKGILLGRREQFARALTERLLTYALGRGLGYHDNYAVAGVVKALQKNDYRIGTMIDEIVLSEPFRMRRPTTRGAAK